MDIDKELRKLGLEPVYDLRCWTCGQGRPAQPGWLCNKGDDCHKVLVGATVINIVHPNR